MILIYPAYLQDVTLQDKTVKHYRGIRNIGFLRQKPEELATTFSVNVFGAMACARAATRVM